MCLMGGTMIHHSHESQGRYEWILDSLATGVFTVDANFIITYFNSQAELLTGYSKKEALGRQCWEIFKTNHCRTHCNLQQAMKEDSRIYNARLTMRNRYNKEIPVAITAAVLHDQEGRILGGVESFQDDRARVALEKEVKGSYGLSDFVTQDAALLQQLEKLPIIANSSKPMLILGETGVGKDFLARIVHNISNRRQGPYIKVNCAAIPGTMLESELFGYKKGAFTDAKYDKPGKFKLAQNGTILLDELGELRLDMQAKLLQVIEDKEFFPLGATKMEWVNARIIATTNCELQRMINAGTFRKDLYYRLKMYEFRIDPLRERRGDLGMLIEYFLNRSATINNRETPQIKSEVLDILTSYTYPGNVRELRNIIEYAVMTCDGCVQVKDVPEYVLSSEQGMNLGQQTSPEKSEDDLQATERKALLRALHRNKWHIQNTAQSLHMNRTTLWRKMKKHNLSGQSKRSRE